MALNTVSSDRLSTNVKNTNFTAAEKQDLTDDILPLAGQLGNRNLIINGAMQVAQRGTSSTSSGYQTVDRFKSNFTGLDNSPTMAQVDVASGTTPYTQGFRKAFKVTNGNQSSGAGAGDQFSISYLVEDQDLATSGWNYLSATSYVTLSFWFKSSVAQTFYVVLESKDGTSRQYSFAITPTSADTWTKVTHTIPGNTGLQFSNDNGEGIEIYFLLFYGTNATTSGHTLNTWKTTSSSDQAPDMTSTWYTTNNATWEMTAVQLEVGSVATDFEHLSFGDDLRKCQRYYEETYVMTDAGNSYVRMYTQWKVEKRANGTSTAYALRPDGTGTGTANKAYQASGEPTAACNYPWTGGTMIQVSGYAANTDCFANIRCDAEL